MRLVAAGTCLVLCTISNVRADWKPAAGPLMTRWAKDVTSDRVHPDYPRPQMVRKEWQSLNGLWQVAFPKEGEPPPIGKDLGQQILVPFPVESALSGVMKHADRLWYRRTFAVPGTWNARRVLLHFGAVDWEATVWVNGHKLGVHRGGYDPFSWDITDHLKGDGNEELVVGVWDPTDAGTQPRGKQVLRPSGIYYTPTTGIWQTVWLEPVPASSIAKLQITTDVDAGALRLSASLRGVPERATLQAEVRDDGKLVGSASIPFKDTLAIPIPNAKLWSPASPFLYDLHVELRDGDRMIDAVDSYFGMREIALGKDDKGTMRILLNGKPLFQVGPLDQGFWPDGLYTAPTDEALRYDIEITRKLGFNMARKHVKVEPARWYYWCDKLGLLVWQDMPSGDRSVAPGRGEIKRTADSARQFEQELNRMLESLRNHPSIVLWVVFNEGWGQFETERWTNWTKQVDPTRLVDCASGWNDRKVGDVHDVHVYPGPGAPPIETNRAAVLGEFGGLGLGVDGHTWARRTWGYRGASSQEDLTRKYERLLQNAWNLKDTHGLCAAIYTQITDVETEANGLLTYDRAVIKVHLERAAAANRGQFTGPREERVTVVPTSETSGVTWRYTLDRPPADWFTPDFADQHWKRGLGGFGTHGTPGAVVRTEWKTDDIWLRREFTLPKTSFADLRMAIHHDEDAEVYLNGVLATKLAGFSTEYEDVPITKDARAALRTGQNVIAVHCKQTTGGQYIDVGLVEFKKAR